MRFRETVPGLETRPACHAVCPCRDPRQLVAIRTTAMEIRKTIHTL
jgi:hypothetical protein